MKDPEPKVREKAAESLGSFRRESEASLHPLLGLLSDNDVAVRRAAVLSLGSVGKGNQEVEDGLRKLTADPDPVLKLNTVISLANMGKADDSAIPVLVDALSSKEEPTAKAAVSALGEIGHENPDRVLPGMMDTLNKKEPVAAANAVKVLMRMKTKAGPALALISEAYNVVAPADRLKVIDALVMVDQEGTYAVPVLNKALDEHETRDRKEALIGLMRYRSKPELIIDSLVKGMNDSAREIQILAVNMLKGLGKKAERALPKVLAMTQGPNVEPRLLAMNAAVSIGPESPETLKMLEGGLADGDVRVKQTAVALLRRVGMVKPQEVAPVLQKALESEQNDQIKQSERAVLELLNNRAQPPAPSASAVPQKRQLAH
ncbi:MAG: HEAT repeat domain-containing protein [Desulfomonile tiedjei]|nr:HEAT repeat domain-containing protein [Desulfomonile tiedjei]